MRRFWRWLRGGTWIPTGLRRRPRVEATSSATPALTPAPAPRAAITTATPARLDVTATLELASKPKAESSAPAAAARHACVDPENTNADAMLGSRRE